jgi:hypothetical protein
VKINQRPEGFCCHQDSNLSDNSRRKKMAAANMLARELIDQLDQLGIKHLTGYFGGRVYCVGVQVADHAEAVKLGLQIKYQGEVGFDIGGAKGISGHGAIIAFRDALAMA